MGLPYNVEDVEKDNDNVVMVYQKNKEIEDLKC